MITEIKRVGKSENYKIFVDGVLFCVLCAEVIVLNKIKSGCTFSFDEWESFKKQNSKLCCFSDCLKFVSRCLKTKRQASEYLQKKGYFKDDIENAVAKVCDYGYINDLYFAKSFIESKNGTKGKMYLKSALIQKGVSKGDIEIALEDFDTDISVLENLAQKFVKNKKADNLKEKLCRHLLAKGFAYTDIKKVADKIVKGESCDAWD